MNNKRMISVLKGLALSISCCILIGSMAGCQFSSRADYLARTSRSDDEQSEATKQSIINALETRDTQGLKAMFSQYALENAEDLDEKIQELIDFYPGCNGGFNGGCSTLEGTDYGVRTKVLNGTYTVTNDNEEYYLIFTIQLRNDEEPDKVGLHLIEVMTEEAMPEGFKCKDEDDAPGVYVLE